MAPPTQTYVDAAKLYGTDVESLMTMLLYNRMQMPTFDTKLTPALMRDWLPGCHFGSKEAGPSGMGRVVAIGKMPGANEMREGANFVGESGKLLREIAYEIGYPELNDWYVTNLLRYQPPDGGKTIKPQHIKDCMPLLAQELGIMKPELIVLLGADAVKAVCGKDATLGAMRSNIFLWGGVRGLFRLPRAGSEVDELTLSHSPKLVVTIHPAAVLREEGLKPGLKADLILARDASRNLVQDNTDFSGREYLFMDKPKPLKALVDRLLKENIVKLCIDCEWGAADFKKGPLRSIQFSWGKNTSCTVFLLRCGGAPAQTYAERVQIIEELRRLFCVPGRKIRGHNFRSDAKRLEYLGLNVMAYFDFDSMLADHALNENAEHGLEACTIRFTSMGRYDWAVGRWLKDNNYNKKKLRERGFLDIPDNLFNPYAACDPDAGYQVCEALEEIMARPENTTVKWCFDNVIMPANMPLHESETNGLLVDRDRMVDLVGRYNTKRKLLRDRFCELIGNLNFNPGSSQQLQRLLFDEMKLTPYKTTGKPARMWEDVLTLPPEQQKRYSPSTDAETLEALASDDTGIIAALRDWKIVDSMCKSFLRLPEEQDDGSEEYEGGLVSMISSTDGRVHTSLSQTSETGRQKSSDPNMQNLPKKQDKEYERIMGKETSKIRSCFIASPGCVIVEADYKSAEIYTLGYLANCKKLLLDADSDLHARGAVNYFNAPKWDGFEQRKKPPADWLKEHKSLRVGAKTVNFGIPYQRGAKAVARQIVRETKGLIQCTAEMAQEFIDGFYNTYPEVRVYVDMCKDSVLNPGYISNAYGRRRRFYANREMDRGMLAAMQREAVNMPIQGTVADTLNVAQFNLWGWRRVYPGRCNYKYLLPVHDAMLIEVPGEEAHFVVNEILPTCMKWGAMVPSWRPIPEYTPTEPFCLDIDIEVTTRWGESATPEELRAANVPDSFIEELVH